MQGLKELQFKNILATYGIQIPEQEIAEFASIFKPTQFYKGEYLHEIGSMKSYLAYITQGLVRFYLTRDDGKEFNQTFKTEHQIAMNYFTSFLGTPAPFAAQCLEDTQALIADYEEVKSFYTRSMAWAELGRKTMELNFILKAQREKELIVNSASETYVDFDRRFPGLKSRVSKHHLSLYLGINPASLSRLVKSMG